MSKRHAIEKNYKGSDLQGKFSSKLTKHCLNGSKKTYLNLVPAQ